MSRNARFVEPEVIAEDPELHRIWLEAVRASQAAYRELADRLTEKFKDIPDRTLRRKKAREAARSVLPNATETKIFVTANARALRHFIEMRGDAAADVEIRRLAIAVCKLLQAEAPNLFGDYTLVDLPEGGQAVTTEHRKVSRRARSLRPLRRRSVPAMRLRAAPAEPGRAAGRRWRRCSPRRACSLRMPGMIVETVGVGQDPAQGQLGHRHPGGHERPEGLGAVDARGEVLRHEVAVAPVALGPAASPWSACR